jgi:lysophospholipid acyltransferase (LPLAT)-like uncharacterized protein
VNACLAKGERAIVAFWHGRLLMMPFVYPGQPVTILISQHRDGEYITRVAQWLGFTVVRGSATRGGAAAFKQLVQALRDGGHVVVTPDGPKGPRQRVKSGVIALARLTGMPILPVACGAWPRIILKSWDRFLVPYPLGRVVYVWGEPLYVPADTDKAGVEKYQSLLADRLDALVMEADALGAHRTKAFGCSGHPRHGGHPLQLARSGRNGSRPPRCGGS